MPSEQQVPTAGGGATQAAIEHHYDVGSEFYRLWLGEEMVYSCGLWTGPLDDDLEAAQQAKLDWHATGAQVDGAQRVLDVGCGWGAMLRYLVAERGVARATGLTLSSDQAAVAAASCPPVAEVLLEDWRDHRPDAPYDAIVSVGAFEHFARSDLDAGQRLAVYSEFFAACAGWLPPGRRLSLQTIAYEDFDPATSAVSPFFTEEVFPESALPLLPEIVAASHRWFRLVTFRSDAEHYCRTLRLWQQRLEAGREVAVGMVGRDTYRHYLRYLRLSRAMFERDVCTLYRFVLQRRPTPR